MEEKLLNVYIPSEKIYGTVKIMGAFASIVTYQIEGIQYEELMENQDFEVID